jgi:hypothetical protein
VEAAFGGRERMGRLVGEFEREMGW